MDEKEIIVEIDMDILAKFESLPDASNWGYDWTPQRKQLLLKYWPIKKHMFVANLLGISTNTALKKYREFSSAKNEETSTCPEMSGPVCT